MKKNYGNILFKFFSRSETPVLIFLIILTIAISFFTPNFLTIGNLKGILEQVVVISIIALAVNQVIYSAEIDISTGSLLAVCAFVYGFVAMETGGSWIALIASLLCGFTFGLFNGFLSTYGKVPSIIVTLGMLFILRGGLLLSNPGTVLNLVEPMRFFGMGTFFGLPVSVICLVLVMLVYHYLSYSTQWGRNIIAIGGNSRAAENIGLPKNKVIMLSFVGSGIMCGFAAAIYLGQAGQIQATAATGFELKVIAAVVLGGTSIAGGRGSNFSPVIGALLVGIILNALTLNRVPAYYELFVLGLLILFAVSFDGFRRKILENEV